LTSTVYATQVAIKPPRVLGRNTDSSDSRLNKVFFYRDKDLSYHSAGTLSQIQSPESAERWLLGIKPLNNSPAVWSWKPQAESCGL
jgi:hypothetical protein